MAGECASEETGVGWYVTITCSGNEIYRCLAVMPTSNNQVNRIPWENIICKKQFAHLLVSC